jgi:diguanylate cyclase (GGDEF)-like protein
MRGKLYGFLLLLFMIFVALNVSYSDSVLHADANEERTVYLSATEYDYPPFSVTDSGEADGFSVDLLKAVAEEMGITVTFRIDQWSVIKQELADGELDILPLVGYTEERDELFDFTVPYIVMRGNIFVRNDASSIQSQDDLFGKEILVLDGDNSQEWAWSIGLDDELTATSTYTEAFELLSSGSYDAVLAQGLVGEKIISDNGFSNIEAVYEYVDDGVTRQKLNLEGYEQKFCFAVVEGDTELLSILNEGLSIVSVNGTYDELYQDWFPFLLENQTVSPFQVLLYVGYVLIPVLIILSVIYIITMKRNIRLKNEELRENYDHNQKILDAFQKDSIDSNKRYEDILHELLKMTHSTQGFIYQMFFDGPIEIKACSYQSKDPSKVNQHLINIIEETDLFGGPGSQDTYILNNDYDQNAELPLEICGDVINRYLALNIKNHDNMLVCVMLNKTTKYRKEDINRTSILITGLWNIVQRQEQYEQIKYISFHDALTNLYNRRFFNEELKRYDHARHLPLTIVMADVNGLKLVNDAFGHRVGDEYLKLAASLLESEARGSDIVARWGGDEFAIIMPNSTSEAAKKLIERVESKIRVTEFKQGKLSVAFGYDTKIKMNQDLSNTFKSAEEMMYHNKNEVIGSVRSETINMILNTLFDKSEEVQQHSFRVSELAGQIASKLGLSQSKVNDIITMGKVHDIGKIIIDSSILNKPSKLTDEEWDLIRQHPQTGSKMLSSTHEYTRLAAGVLHHHEKIDGTGYPNGLKDDEIPLESKIISVADAYDAMTSIRPYRQTPLTKDEAIEELTKHANTQFDKKVVDVFISILNNRRSKKPLYS